VEPKFRISPVIEKVFAYDLEGGNRNKEKTRKEYMKSDRQTRSMVETPDKVALEKRSGNSERTNYERVVKPRSKLFPYVDVPPIRPSVKPMTAPVINRDQSVSNPEKEDRNDLAKGKDPGLVYKSRAPVEAGLDIERLVESVMDLEINVPLRSLAGASGAIQREIRRQMTKTRQLQNDESKANYPKEKEQFVCVDNSPVSCYAIMEEVSEEIPEGHLVANDPVLQYLAENQSAKPSDLVVASTSKPLRAIYAVINGVGQEECLIDNGSSIVSMAKHLAVQKGLNWDPYFKISMESATNHVEQTLGLAKNVCFRIGGINVYLQVHILDDPPYGILLGRPFDALTTSIIKTAADGSSEITLTDPNTKQSIVVPTYKRGEGPDELQKQRSQGF
jgi:hypothetical protein